MTTYLDNPVLDLPTRIERHKQALTVDDLAGFTRISTKKLYVMANRGTLPSYRIGTSVRLDPLTTAAWLRRQRNGSAL